MKRLALILVVAAACGGSSSSNPADAPPASPVKTVPCAGATVAQTVTVVSTPQFAFSPMTLTIHVNDVVHFQTGSLHPVASGAQGHPDGKFSTTGDACLQFTQAGTFPFFCNVHGFPGTVTVQ
jgi:plastocyanin